MANHERIIGKNQEGKKLEEKDLGEIRDELAYRREKGDLDLPEEMEKSPEDLKIIEETKTLLTQELESLGVTSDWEVDPKKIHFLKHENFLKITKAGTKAFVDPISGHMYIDDEGKQGIIRPSRLNELQLLVHESIHGLSHTKYYLDEQRKSLDTYRMGYFTNNVSSAEDAHDHFTGLNEAVTETMAVEVIKKNREALDDALAFTEEDWEALQSPYEREREILQYLIKKIAEKNDEPEEEVWSRFKKSAFTGELMHLRDIERTFGKGALRVVAAIDSGTILQNVEAKQGHLDVFKRDAVNKRILEYLQTDDEARRDAIASVLLNEREYIGVRVRQDEKPDTTKE